MDIYNTIKDKYEYYLSLRDERVKNWPLIESPLPMIYLVIGYLIFVIVGMKYMKNRKPMELKYPMILHNLLCALISAYMTIETIRQAYINNYSFVCNAVDYSESGIGMAKILWLFFFSKSIEFMDTVFMILRGKLNQVTFLHVYHHSSIFFLWWIGVNWTAGGDAYLSAAVNSFVHTVMYTYYLLAALKIQPWWKKYLTQLQLAQFVLNVGTSIYVLCQDCPFPRWMMWAMIVYMAQMLLLFGSFYLGAYIKPAASKKKIQ